MWDLMRGKGCASTKLGKEGEKVIWNGTGSMFVISSGKEIDVYKTDMTVIHSIEHSSRVHDVHFCGDLLLVGSEAPKVAVYAISKEEQVDPVYVMELVGATNR